MQNDAEVKRNVAVTILPSARKREWMEIFSSINSDEYFNSSFYIER